MGMARHRATGTRAMLHAEHIFGRDPQRANSVLQTPNASALHAVARWRGQRWELVDLSRNGTVLHGVRLERGCPVPLAAGLEVVFGVDEVWEVVDTAPPGPALMPLDEGVPTLPLRRHNLLPTPSAPQLVLYEEDEGVWVLEQGGERRHVREGDAVVLHNRRYVFFPGEGCDETLEAVPQQAEPLRLSFQVSLDEEHTCLQLSRGPQKVDLGERVHHYTLLTLARQRLADARSGLDPQAQGWLERTRLARMLGMDVGHLNIQLYRARDQFTSAWPNALGTADILQTRRGGVRLGDVDVHIHRGTRLEGRIRAGRADPP